MIIWRGLGILVGVAGFAGLVVAELITRAITQDNSYYASHVVSKMGGAVVAGVFAYGMVRLLAKGNAPRVMIDKATGREILITRGDALFFVPSKYLPYVIFFIGAVAALVRK